MSTQEKNYFTILPEPLLPKIGKYKQLWGFAYLTEMVEVHSVE